MVKIRQATPSDTEELVQLFISVFDEDIEILARKCIAIMKSDDFYKATFIVAERDGKIIGSCAYSEEMFTMDVWGISWVAVLPPFQGEGLGQSLIENCENEIIKEASKTVTAILATYPGKTGLYSKCGFEISGKNHEGGCFMTKTLKCENK